MDGSTYRDTGWKRLWPFGRTARRERAEFDERLSDYDRRLAELEGELGGPGGAAGEIAEGPLRWWQGRSYWWWIKRGLQAFLILFVVLVAFLAITAPLSKSLKPIAAPQITLLASDGTPIARNGANVAEPVAVADLPEHVIQPFLAIEDRRFYNHWGVDPRGIARAAWTGHGGGSTITQQLAKFTFLTPEQTLTRKAREALIAFWLEAWLTKDEILERYLSNAYFGDNQYGLRAASLHYFYRKPENLKPEQAAMLAGLLKAPSRLAPTKNPDLAEKRYRLVLGAMVEAGYLTQAQAKAMKTPALDVRTKRDLPTGTYFADWALPEARELSETGYNRATITTTLDSRLQNAARRAVERAPLGDAQVALVAMRTNGEVVAMIGGKDYSKSAFNRATQARRQPGSTFKLFVYLAALEAGMRPSDTIDNRPIEEGSYRPQNSGGRYSNTITLEDAFARSSNVAAVRLWAKVGDDAVIRTARELGVTSPMTPGDPSLALGTSTMTLMELTAAYAAVAAGEYPVEPSAFPAQEKGWFEEITGSGSLSGRVQDDMKDLLRAAVNKGTGRAAMLRVPNFGKTGTTQDNRDALFVGFAGDLVVGVWVGNDDNSPLGNVSGGTVPARIWRDFMTAALGNKAALPSPSPAPAEDPGGPVEPLDVPDLEDIPLGENGARMRIREGEVVIEGDNDIPLDLRIDEDGVRVEPRPRRREEEPQPEAQ